MTTMRVMKGQNIKTVPMAFLDPHRRQADRNHGQTLERLNERGGLSACEMLAVLYDVDFRMVSKHIDHEAHLIELLAKWNTTQALKDDPL